MRFLNFLIFALCAGVGVCALPGEVLDRGAGAAFYSSDWDDGTAKHTYTNGPNGLYSVVWSGDKGNFVSGKGYNPGGPR
jgi:endo-1,4-beta-xylanase